MSGADNHLGQNFDHLLEVNGKFLPNVYSTGAGADNPGGLNSFWKRKPMLLRSFL